MAVLWLFEFWVDRLDFKANHHYDHQNFLIYFCLFELKIFVSAPQESLMKSIKGFGPTATVFKPSVCLLFANYLSEQ